MDVVQGVEALRPEHGPVFAVIGVFDGLHRGHLYLLDRLGRAATARAARPTVITFDHHPDEVLTGTAPPLLLDPGERLERLADAGITTTVIQPFDEHVRRTPFEDFLRAIQARTALAGLLMTPDAAFGFERRGTPDAVADFGREHGFEVVVVPPFTLGGATVSSSAIRAAIGRGDLGEAEWMLGRPVSLRAAASHGRLEFDWPMAMPPDGTYRCSIDGTPMAVVVADRQMRVDAPVDGAVDVRFVA